MRILLTACIALLCCAPLQAETERILDFSSLVLIDPDGSLVVSETITVQATGDQIKRGIVREFPTVYPGRDGKRVRIGFTLLGVQRDGADEPYHTEEKSNGVAIYVGSKDVFLQPGRYSYTLIYRTTKQLGFFEGHDELYWNVNGNGWRLPLDRVSCEVRLPGEARALEAVAYEGPMGSTDSRTFPAQGLQEVKFSSSRPYAPGEGLTVAVSWPKGFVVPPSATEQAAQVMAEGGGLLPVGMGVALLFVYYILAWMKVGRDPQKGVIIPRFAPPHGFSPAMVRMLWRMKFDNVAFTVAVINMAVKGALKIEDNAKMRLELADQAPGSLSIGERAVWDELRGAGTSIELKNANHRVFGRARQAIRDKLGRELSSTYFLTNTGWVLPGLVITLATVAVLAWAAPVPPELLFICVWLTGWTFGCFMLVRQVVTSWRARGVRGKFSAVLLSVFALPFLGAEAVGLWVLTSLAGLAPTLGFAVMILMNALFYELLKAPTRIGRQTLDEIEGFKLYLSVAEEDRLNFIHPPDETPELFEKFLPYAIALGVENQWGERFARLLDQAGYQPEWYSGHHWNRLHPGSFATSLGQGLQSSISSASSAPGSSSGMGGGGSSGGGGGGGGGGGW
jgi:uncharacterized membrane protein YgcG